MATNFPTSLDNGTSLPYPSSSNLTNSPSLSSGQDNQNDSLIAIQNKLGITASTPTASNLLIGTGAGTSTWSKLAPTGVIVGTTDSQTLTNKTLTSPTITGAILTNANITTDLITGFTTSNSGTVFGVPVTIGVIQTANTIDGVSLKPSTIQTASIANQAVTATKMQYGVIRQRQGGTTGVASWYTSGTSNTDLTTSAVFFQVGTILVNANPTVVTFPIAFSQVPHVQITEASANAANAFCLITALTTTTVSLRVINDAGTIVTTEYVSWMAVGI